jgi:hypothetical protein
MALEHRLEGVGQADDRPSDVTVRNLQDAGQHFQGGVWSSSVWAIGAAHEAMDNLVPADVRTG